MGTAAAGAVAVGAAATGTDTMGGGTDPEADAAGTTTGATSISISRWDGRR